MPVNDTTSNHTNTGDGSLVPPATTEFQGDHVTPTPSHMGDDSKSAVSSVPQSRASRNPASSTTETLKPVDDNTNDNPIAAAARASGVSQKTWMSAFLKKAGDAEDAYYKRYYGESKG